MDADVREPLTFRLNFPNPVPDDASTRVPMRLPNGVVIYRDLPLSEGTPWTHPDYGWPLVVVGRENDGRTLVLKAQRPAHLDGDS